MDRTTNIRNKIKELFISQKLAVLATSNAGQPYTSLVAFWGSEDLKYLYFVTPKSTRKFANLSNDHRVSMLINNTTNSDDDFHDAVSVTAIGRSEEITGSQKEKMLSHYLNRHPFLEEFARSPTCALIRITVAAYYMVEKFQKVMELHIKS
jgi:nitroimidazol reductase NimA-like FMN-containing flavoprotein (pyridoxamine 5'-phosphate oxidase superfamily)